VDERAELVRLRKELRVARMEDEILKRASAYFARENVLPKRVTGPLVADLAADGHDVTVVCRLIEVPRSSYYAWARRWSAPTEADVEEAHLANVVFDIHQGSQGCYGAPRVHAELTLGLGLVINRKKTARLLRVFARQGSRHHGSPEGRSRPRRSTKTWCCASSLPTGRTGSGAPTSPSTPPVRGMSTAARVLDVWSRMIVGWSIADHIRSELVVDALEMARWNRHPDRGTTIMHSDRGSQYTSWIFGHRLREAGLLDSMGRVASCDNAQAESLIGLYKAECCWPEGPWRDVNDLELATSDWVSWFNTTRLHGALDHLPPLEYEQNWHAAQQRNPPTWWPTQDSAA